MLVPRDPDVRRELCCPGSHSDCVLSKCGEGKMPLETCMRRIVAPDTISLDEIRVLANARFGDMIKGVVDLDRAGSSCST